MKEQQRAGGRGRDGPRRPVAPWWCNRHLPDLWCQAHRQTGQTWNATRHDLDIVRTWSSSARHSDAWKRIWWGMVVEINNVKAHW